MSEEAAKLRMNLVAIQKTDPYASEIMDSSPHVAFYKFDTSSNEWSSMGIEGSFFVYSRVAEPYNSIFINNRLNTNCLVEPVTQKIELQEQAPFLLYRNQRSVISGFWFYCKDDCVRIHKLLEKLIKDCNSARPDQDQVPQQSHPQQLQQQQQQQQPRQKPTSAPQNGSGKQDVDIFSMLSKAQEDFNSSGTSNHAPGPQQLNQKFAGMILNNGPPQSIPPQHPPLMKQLSNAMPDITSPNVVHFFAAAQAPFNGAKTDAVKMNQPHNNHTIMGNQKAPPVQTLDEIEKQHRVSASPPGSKNDPKMINPDFNNLINSVAQQQQHQQHHAISPQPEIMKLQQPGAFQPSVKPALITPAMLQASKGEEKVMINNAPMPVVQQVIAIRPEPLTQNQLIQAMNYLLETDPDFIRKLHEAYIKSFNKIVSL